MNKLTLIGTVDSEKVYSHEVLGEKFYRFQIKTKRTSGTDDVINCVISEIYTEGLEIGSIVKIQCEIRTHNIKSDEKTSLDIFAFVVDKPEVLDEEEKYKTNEGAIEGFICKIKPSRVTPAGRVITDMVVAVNRAYGKSDYIPSIVWGRNAQRANTFKVGDAVKLEGRLQSRTYRKCVGEDNYEDRVAYEFSARTIGYAEIKEQD